MFYYKNIGENEVPEYNQRRQFIEAKSEDFALRIAASGCIWNVIVSASHNKTYPVYSAMHAGESPF